MSMIELRLLVLIVLYVVAQLELFMVYLCTCELASDQEKNDLRFELSLHHDINALLKRVRTKGVPKGLGSKRNKSTKHDPLY
ncbi:hypothetical protein CR513_09647, partial [Mucuna pruriens]